MVSLLVSQCPVSKLFPSLHQSSSLPSCADLIGREGGEEWTDWHSETGQQGVDASSLYASIVHSSADFLALFCEVHSSAKWAIPFIHSSTGPESLVDEMAQSRVAETKEVVSMHDGDDED